MKERPGRGQFLALDQRSPIPSFSIVCLQNLSSYDRSRLFTIAIIDTSRTIHSAQAIPISLFMYSTHTFTYTYTLFTSIDTLTYRSIPHEPFTMYKLNLSLSSCIPNTLLRIRILCLLQSILLHIGRSLMNHSQCSSLTYTYLSSCIPHTLLRMGTYTHFVSFNLYFDI